MFLARHNGVLCNKDVQVSSAGGRELGVGGVGEGVSTGHVTVTGLKQLQSVGVEAGEERKAPRASYRNQK